MTQGYIQIISTKGQFKDCALQTWYVDNYGCYQGALTAAYDFLDRFFVTLGHRSFLEELNEMQHNVNGDGNFSTKTTIPLYFINLVLRPYNLKIKVAGRQYE